MLQSVGSQSDRTEQLNDNLGLGPLAAGGRRGEGTDAQSSSDTAEPGACVGRGALAETPGTLRTPAEADRGAAVSGLEPGLLCSVLVQMFRWSRF